MENITLPTYSQKLTDLIKETSMSRAELSEKTGLSLSTIYRLTSGQIRMLYKHAKILNRFFRTACFSPEEPNGEYSTYGAKQSNVLNEFKVGQKVIDLYNGETRIISEVYYNKSRSEWRYRLVGIPFESRAEYQLDKAEEPELKETDQMIEQSQQVQQVQQVQQNQMIEEEEKQQNQQVEQEPIVKEYKAPTIEPVTEIKPEVTISKSENDKEKKITINLNFNIYF